MSKTPSSRVRRVAALFATVLSCLLPPRAFSYTRNQPLVTSSPSGIQNHMPPTFGNSNAQFGLTGRAAVPEKYVAPRDFGGKHAEALFTAMVAGLATYAMSTLQFYLHRQLWVPPLGAVTLIFSADAVAAAKEGRTLNWTDMRKKIVPACIGVAGACFLTVLLARLLGGSPGVLRACAMAVATYSMMVNPRSGYFPPAGALCALYVEKVVSTGISTPSYVYALFPCATGVALLLIFCRMITFAAHPLWPFSSKQGEKEMVAQP
eukprot:symbB.v1.2.037128.t1/scaffold5398.1/size27587/1